MERGGANAVRTNSHRPPLPGGSVAPRYAARRSAKCGERRVRRWRRYDFPLHFLDHVRSDGHARLVAHRRVADRLSPQTPRFFFILYVTSRSSRAPDRRELPRPKSMPTRSVAITGSSQNNACPIRRRLMSNNETSIRQGLPAVSQITSTGQRGDSKDRPSAASGIGFAGLGRMGTAMAANLTAAGHRVIAYVRHADQLEKLAGLGLEPTTDITRLSDCDVVVSMLPDDAAVRDVVLGRQNPGTAGLATGLKPGAIHLSMSTISTSAASDLAKVHARQGQSYVAAPVFGNPDAAKACQLFIVAAGAQVDVERCQPLFDSLGHAGDAGRGRRRGSQAWTRSRAVHQRDDQHDVRRTCA